MIKDSLIILEQGNFITTKLWNIGTGIYYVTEDDSLNNELKYINDKQVNTIEKINYAMYRSIYTGGQVYHNNFIYAFDKTIYYCEKDQVTKYDFDYVVANANRVHDMLIITELYQDNEGNAKQRLHLYDLKSNQEIRTIDTFFASQFTDEKENIMYINFSNRYLQVMHFDENTNEDIKQLNEFNASSLWIPINEPYFAECIDYEHYNIYKIVS